MRTTMAILSGLLCAGLGASPALAEAVNAAGLAGLLSRQHAHLFDPAGRQVLNDLNRGLREAEEQLRKAAVEEDKKAAQDRLEKGKTDLIALLAKCPGLMRVTLAGGKLTPPQAGFVTLPGDRGAVLICLENGPGSTQFVTAQQDLTEIRGERAVVAVRGIGPGSNWILISLTGVPALRTTLAFAFEANQGQAVSWPVDLISQDKARLKIRILDEDGKPTPAMVRLTWVTGGDVDVRPSNVVDFSAQFDSQGAATSHRIMNTPGGLWGYYWVVPGPFDMVVPAGEWRIIVRRGAEHVPVQDSFTTTSNQTTEKAYTVNRWADLRKLGWYSGDDHVHNRILSDDDARRLMTYVKAEDIHLANIVKMGDIYRTWFEQRGFGKEYRVIDGDYILSPGQECPRTHQQIGHTISMNITSMVRDTDKYYSYDWVADTVHQQGGLWGYAHVCGPAFHVHRDMSVSIPQSKVDFVELLQFAHLGTDLFYDFLDLGFKVTASAGSDVPWGGTVGEVRVYSFVGDGEFNADRWFEGMKKGRTFVTNGPMIEFKVDEALPGDEVRVSGNRKLRVQARAWGDPARMTPIKLEIVRHSEVIRAQTGGNGQAEVKLDFELDAGCGFWIAARVSAAEGLSAHTTPVYVVREGLRFWRPEAVSRLTDKTNGWLDEIEKIVAEAKAADRAGKVETDRAVKQLAVQGDDLLKRVAAARKIYAELKVLAEKEKETRAGAETPK
ncbi:MAG: CehA/McbA family metallohydrolase [Phycisphaerae bacterium]|nr:CehA/McbA family metallohydrolase [Phycisphaerae bacterium]